MKMMAVDTSTGKMLMSNDGSMNEKSFKSTVLSSFPQLTPDKLVIISDGKIRDQDARTPQKRHVPKSKAVLWRGSFSDLGGYANMNREICMRLPHHGFHVKIEMLKTGMQVDSMTQNLLRSLETTKLNNTSRCPVVVGFTPMSIRRMSRRTIFYTMMESQSLHPEFVNRCNDSADEIWVPGDFYANVFRKYGVIKPIHVMPLGVNHFTYTSDAVEPELRYEEMPSGVITTDLPYGTRFMSLFGWSYRKGPDVLCRSFLEEFDSKDDAYLVIYSRYMGSAQEQHKQFVRDEINGYYKQCGKKNPPRIFYCGDEIPISDMPGCYAAADAFVFCSRGEGFGLILMEAGACETPIISTRNTAMTDYLDDDVAFCIEPDEVAPANEKLCWISEYYRDQEFVVLGDKAVAQCRRHMREVASNKEEASRRAQNFKKRIVEKYTWDACTARVARRLKVGT